MDPSRNVVCPYTGILCNLKEGPGGRGWEFV